MSGRPLRLVYTPPTWAPAGTNYPVTADPWSNTAVRQTPIVTFFTPNVAPAAEDANWLHGSAFDGLLTLENAHLAAFDFLGAIQAQNWTKSTVTQGLTCVAWDPFGSRWLQAYGTGASVQLARSFNGTDWIALTPTTTFTAGFIDGLIVNPGTGLILAFGQQGAGPTSGVYSCFNGTSWSAQQTFATIPDQGPTGSVGFFFSGKFVFMVCRSPAVTGCQLVNVTADGVTMSFPTIPAGFGTGVGAATGAASSSLAIIAAAVASNVNYMTSADGVTWTARTFPGAVVGAGDSCKAMSYSATDGLFMVAVQSGSATRFATSPDGITWTVKATLSAPVKSLAVIGSVWVGLTVDGVDPIGSRVYFSVDAGATWTITDFGFTLASINAISTVIGNGSQFLATNGQNVLGSLAAS